MLPVAGMYRLAVEVRVGRGGRAWCSRRGPGACRVAAIIGGWLPGGVICGGGKSVGRVCAAFGLTAGPGASIVPVSRGRWDGCGAWMRARSATRLRSCSGLLRDLADLVTPTAGDRLVTCHRDLHPGNVLVEAPGELAVLDWDDAVCLCPA